LSRVEYTLAASAVGKPSRAGELELSNRCGEIPDNVVGVARAWFLARQQTPECQYLTALHRVAGGWWVLALFDEDCEEDGIQFLSPALGLARVSPTPSAGDVPSLLSSFFKACPLPLDRPAPRTVEAERLEAGPAETTDKLAEAALELAVFGRSMIFPDESAAYVLAHVDLRNVTWVARVGGGHPANPPPGVGLFLHDDAVKQWPARVDASSIVTQARPVPVLRLPLASLAALREPGEVRAHLVRAVLRLGPVRLPPTLALPSLRWLLRSEAGRWYALQCAPPEALTELLKDLQELSADEARLLKGRALPEHADAVASLLAKSRSADRFQAFHQVFSQEQRPRLDLLEPHVRAVWQALEGADPEGPPLQRKDVDDFLAVWRDVKDQVRLRPTLPGLARGFLGGHDQMRTWFAGRLEKGGLPAELIDVLLDRWPPTTALPVLRPPSDSILEPDMGWLRAINPAIFLRRCAAWLYHSAWCRWWKQGARALAREPSKERKGDLYFSAISTGDVELLREHAQPVVADLADPDREKALFPPPGWPPSANLLLQRMHEDGSLWRRIRPFGPGQALPALAWLYQALGGKAQDVGACYYELKDQKPLSPDWLRRLAPLLPRNELLEQIVAWAAFGDEQAEALGVLLGQEALKGEQADWLRALLGLGRLGPVPSCWGPRDLLALLPLLDPVRDVVREVFSWPPATDAEGEAQLLEEVCQRLEKERVGPELLLPTSEQRDLRTRWVERLRKLPGWGGFTPAPPPADALTVTVVVPFDPFAPQPHKQPKA
jgi:hypothetical protein